MTRFASLRAKISSLCSATFSLSTSVASDSRVRGIAFLPNGLLICHKSDGHGVVERSNLLLKAVGGVEVFDGLVAREASDGKGGSPTLFELTELCLIEGGGAHTLKGGILDALLQSSHRAREYLVGATNILGDEYIPFVKQL
jgi:hypothetical protein